jgi:acetyl esterase
MKIDTIGESGVLRPEIRKFLDDLPSGEEELSPKEARKNIRKAILEEWSELRRPFDGTVTDTRIPSKDHTIPVRVYKPDRGERLPILNFYHGGGWVICDLDTHDQMAKLLAAHIPAVVVSVDYRLAPEYPFPSGLQDCYESLIWCKKNAEKLGADPTKIVVGGDSAGGNLAAATAILSSRKKEVNVSLQLLLFPVIDISSTDRDSYRNYKDGYMLTSEEMAWYRNHYISKEEDVADPLVSPLHNENFDTLAAACIVTAEFDILRDEAEDYAKKLHLHGISVRCTRCNGVIHGFLSMDKFVAGIESMYRTIGEQVREML